MEIIGIKTKVKKNKFDLFNSILQSGFEFYNGDILVISSKYVSVSEGRVIQLDRVKVSQKARILASRYNMDPKMAELVLRESDQIFGGVPGFLLALKDGILAPNGGIDKSNVPSGSVILYPKQPFKIAYNIRLKFLLERKLRIGIVISDSRLMPTRIGTVGIALASSGFEPVEDQRGKLDLYGNVLRVTFKATADSMATAGVALMGESNESMPMAIVRDSKITISERRYGWQAMAVDAYQDIYIRGLNYGEHNLVTN